ncbi:MAG: FAD:protein FMN transferase [Acidimicrobiales bacterium]
MSQALQPVTFAALGTTAVVSVADGADRRALDRAVAMVAAEVAALDAACSRFRDDSELSRLNAAGGRPFPVSPLLRAAVAVALRAARMTGGLVNPTVGTALQRLGYDRDFAQLDPDGPPLQLNLAAVPGWQGIVVDDFDGTIRLPRGVSLDLGATAKAWCADRSAKAAAETAGTGILVSLGGDIAVAGNPPPGGWRIRVTDRHDGTDLDPGQTITVTAGGLATSGTASRRWRRGGVAVHHIVDPVTGASATGPWRTVSVAAGSCCDANTASTAAVILGAAAPEWLGGHGLAARLVTVDGAVVCTGGWPSELTEEAA